MHESIQHIILQYFQYFIYMHILSVFPSKWKLDYDQTYNKW